MKQPLVFFFTNIIYFNLLKNYIAGIEVCNKYHIVSRYSILRGMSTIVVREDCTNSLLDIFVY